MKASKVKQGILDYLSARPDENAFIRSEFNALSRSRSGVDKAIRALVAEGVLVRGGYGVFVRGEIGALTGKFIPVVSVDQFSREVLRKLDVSFGPNSALRAYNEDRSTQVPAWLAYEVGKSRIVRKIYSGKRMVIYERNGKWVPLSR
jgi:Transcriptional regulators